MRYRRVAIKGASYFFTVALADRNSSLLVDQITKLRFAFQLVRKKHFFDINGIVILPDHLHVIMTMPEDDSNYSLRWNQIKGAFSRQLVPNERISLSKKKKRERGIWQRRFWEHLIRDEEDYEQHINYIHYNPVKHGYVSKATEWKYSSIHRYIEEGILSSDWSNDIVFEQGKFGE